MRTALCVKALVVRHVLCLHSSMGSSHTYMAAKAKDEGSHGLMYYSSTVALRKRLIDHCSFYHRHGDDSSLTRVIFRLRGPCVIHLSLHMESAREISNQIR